MNRRTNSTVKLHWTITLLLLTATAVSSQTDIPIGSWRNHLAHNRSRMAHIVRDEIYSISEHGMFIYRPEDKGIQLLSKIDGLSEVTITAINHQEGTGLIILGYDNGNIDLIQDREITNLVDIKKADLPYNKNILGIALYNQYIYFITEFGVVAYDQDQSAFKETWQNLSETGDFLRIMNGAVLRDTLFLATEQGIIAGDLSPENNLLDFRNWRRFQPEDGLPAESTRNVEVYKQDLYIVQDVNDIYRYTEGSWMRVFQEISNPVISLTASSSALTITISDRVYYLTEGGVLQEVTDDHFLSLKDAILQNDNLYASDFINGLIHIRPGSSEVIRPSGPFSNDVFGIYDAGGDVVVVPSGYDGQYQPLRNHSGFYYFSGGSWTNYNNSGGSGYKTLPPVSDLVGITYDEAGDRIYFASFGYGMVEWDMAEDFRIYDADTPRVSLVNSNPPGPNTFVSSIYHGTDGKVWMVNYNTGIPLHEYTEPDKWKGHMIPITGSYNITGLIVTADNNKWMIVHPAAGGGILAYNEESGKVRRLTSDAGNGNLPDNFVTAVVEDMEGQIWIGTRNGVAYFPFPFLVFDEPDFEAIRPVYENNFLFKNESITCLDIDGGNRKWIGTEKGAWLFGPDGTALVVHYNQQNSPMLSDRMVDIEVNQASGEVFFGTDKGLISFRGDAVAPAENHSNVKIFPNPVTPNFNGIVGIEGLPQDAIVKITDISGNLVFQTRSEGGIATWNVLDYNGRRPKTGIYLVFSSTEDGNDTFVGKLAIVK